MSRKVYYRYNPVTDSYERVFPSSKERAWTVVRQFIIGIVFGLALFIAAYYLIDFPRERALRAENEKLRDEFQVLGRQADAAIAVMNDIAERDNNFYRVVLQADPITNGQRYAGLERHMTNPGALSDDELVSSVSDRLNQLDKLVYTQSKSFDFLRGQAIDQRDMLDHVPAIQPVAQSKMRQMASGYGLRIDPIYRTQKMHEGMDFSAPIGTPVYATGNGKVIYAGWKTGYGNLIEVDHGYNYVTRYAHLDKIEVKVGQKVERGQQIGLVGNTGKSTGPHLHYEVRLRGKPQNPVNYYFYDLSPEEYDEMILQAENAGHVMD